MHHLRSPRPPWQRPGLWLAAAGAIILAAILVWRLQLGAGVVGDPVWTRVQRSGVLRMGMDASYPPFEMVDPDGRFWGLDVELAQALAARFGARAEFVVVHYDGLFDALQQNKFDLIISALPYDRTMTRDLRYSDSYFNAGLVILARSDDRWGDAVRAARDLHGQPVAVELGSEGHLLMRTLARDQGITAQLSPKGELADVLALLRQGQARAVVCDRVAAQRAVREGGGAFRVVGPPLSDAPYVIAASPEAVELMRQVDLALAEWRQNGYLQELQARWF